MTSRNANCLTISSAGQGGRGVGLRFTGPTSLVGRTLLRLWSTVTVSLRAPVLLGGVPRERAIATSQKSEVSRRSLHKGAECAQK